jgi:hypothetical protein
MKWHNIKDSPPPFDEEVLVWVEGHRGPSWRNNHALVAYLSNYNKEWYEERHDSEPLIGVIKWANIEIPE